jgi:hypothetical protein
MMVVVGRFPGTGVTSKIQSGESKGSSAIFAIIEGMKLGSFASWIEAYKKYVRMSPPFNSPGDKDCTGNYGQ